MAMWSIKAYHLLGGTCPIQDWYRKQDLAVQAEFDVALGILRIESDWTDTKLFKVLRKNHVGLGEVRFQLATPVLRRFRPVGIWPPLTDYEFVLLAGCEKTDRIYIPSDAFDEALTYKQYLKRGEGKIDDYV